MKTRISVFLLLGLLNYAAVGQYYNGKFMHKPTLAEFEHFIVMQDAQFGQVNEVTSVKAFDKSGELWHSVATHVSDEILTTVNANFAEYKDINTVYRLDLDHDGENMHYYMLGFLDETGQEQYLLVEEWYHSPEDVIHVEVNTLVWSHATVRN